MAKKYPQKYWIVMMAYEFQSVDCLVQAVNKKQIVGYSCSLAGIGACWGLNLYLKKHNVVESGSTKDGKSARRESPLLIEKFNMSFMTKFWQMFMYEEKTWAESKNIW